MDQACDLRGHYLATSWAAQEGAPYTQLDARGQSAHRCSWTLE